MSGRAFPSVQAYIDWCELQRCSVTVEQATSANQLLLIVVITAPDGKVAREVVDSLDDLLASTSIARLDRRLGLKSYMFK